MQQEKVTNLFRIGEFSKLGKTSIKTLRYYDECGILKPDKVDLFNNYRYYSTEQLFTLYKIQSLRSAGLTLSEIAEILSGADAETILKERRKELQTDLARIESRISVLDFLLTETSTEKNMYSAVIKEIPECIVFSKTGCVKQYADFMSLIPEIGAEVAAANPDLKCSVPDYCFIQYLDAGYQTENIRYEFCQAVETFGKETETIIFKRLPAATVVSILHKGPYEELGRAYAFIFDWIEKNGHSVCGMPRECYIDGIWNCETADDWLTELQIPVTRKS